MKAIVVAMCVASTAYAGGLAIGEQTAVSAATGGAGAARDDDPGAAWHDPAALADDGGIRVGISLVAARPALEARGAKSDTMSGGAASSGGASWTTDSEAKWATPPHLDVSVARDRWAAGIAVGVPFGGGVTWPQMWPGAFEAVQTQLLDLRAAPFAAYRFGALRVAAGFHVDAARLQIERGLDFIDTRGDVRIDLAGHGAGLDASAYYRASDTASFGVTYRGRTKIDFSGPANFTAPPAFSDKTPDQQAHTEMTMPDQLVLGARWRRGALALLGDAEYTLWHTNHATVVAFDNPATPAAVQPNDWHDTLALRAGGEWQRDRLAVRAGAYFDPSPIPAEHLTPVSPDATRLAATAGASWQLARAWSADVFAEQMWLLRRTTSSVDTMPATYGGTAIVLGAGVRYAPSR